MHRLFLASVFIFACINSVQAECSVAVQKRWENAMTEVMQIERLRVRMKWEEQTTNVALQCRLRDALVEISAAARDYFPACDPHVADQAHVAVLKSEDALGKFDASICAKPKATSAKKK